MLTVSTARFWPNVSPHVSFSRCHSRGKQAFGIRRDVPSTRPPVPFAKQRLLFQQQGAYQFHVDTSSHLFDSSVGRSLAATSEQRGVHSSFRSPLGSPGKLSLIDVISSFGPNDKITAKLSPTSHHTWKKSARLLSANHNKNLINGDSAHIGFVIRGLFVCLFFWLAEE